jgi:hypothetical protein
LGHRALVAYGRHAGRYDLHYAHWGGADLSLAGRLADPETDPVTPDPLAVEVPFAVVVSTHVDPLVHEAVYVVDADEVRAYRSLWLGPLDVDGGLLAAVDWAAPCDDDRVRSWFRGARSLAAAGRRGGHLTPEAAATLLERRLRDWRGDREVLRCPGR